MPQLTPPERIATTVGGRYELRNAVGEGASAVLYAARDRALDREVGVKVMRPTGALSSTREQERFRREAQTLAKLRHPHLVDVFDVGETDDGLPYVVVELLRGETLAARLERTPQLSCAETLALALPLMGALACAHDLGVIHRDIKPANIFLHRRGAGAPVPKLLDFGIAKLSDEPAMTSAGMTLGTPAFMAPEQARGEDLGPAADVWALGVTLYMCLCGRLPFNAPTAAGVLLQASSQGAPGLDGHGVDRGFALVVQRALTLDPRRRIPDMRALARAFVHAAARAGVSLPSEPDAQGLPEYRAWCGAALGELGTDELPVAEPPSLSPSASHHPATSAAASSKSLIAVKAREAKGAWRIAATIALAGLAGAVALWASDTRESPVTARPYVKQSVTGVSVSTPTSTPELRFAHVPAVTGASTVHSAPPIEQPLAPAPNTQIPPVAAPAEPDASKAVRTARRSRPQAGTVGPANEGAEPKAARAEPVAPPTAAEGAPLKSWDW